MGREYSISSGMFPRIVYYIVYIRSFVDYMVGLGYNIVFIDEPVLGVLVGRKLIALGYTEDYIVGVMEKVLGGLSVERGVHVCGRVSDKLFQLLLSI